MDEYWKSLAHYRLDRITNMSITDKNLHRSQRLRRQEELHDAVGKYVKRNNIGDIIYVQIKEACRRS